MEVLKTWLEKVLSNTNSSVTLLSTGRFKGQPDVLPRLSFPMIFTLRSYTGSSLISFPCLWAFSKISWHETHTFPQAHEKLYFVIFMQLQVFCLSPSTGTLKSLQNTRGPKQVLPSRATCPWHRSRCFSWHLQLLYLVFCAIHHLTKDTR